jgi:hypothetical protein
MNPNPNSILSLISDLYAQLSAAHDRIAELEAQLSAPAGGETPIEPEAAPDSLKAIRPRS